jgi:hypothetical protein
MAGRACKRQSIGLDSEFIRESGNLFRITAPASAPAQVFGPALRRKREFLPEDLFRLL